MVTSVGVNLYVFEAIKHHVARRQCDAESDDIFILIILRLSSLNNVLRIE